MKTVKILIDGFNIGTTSVPKNSTFITSDSAAEYLTRNGTGEIINGDEEPVIPKRKYKRRDIRAES